MGHTRRAGQHPEDLPLADDGTTSVHGGHQCVTCHTLPILDLLHHGSVPKGNLNI